MNLDELLYRLPLIGWIFHRIHSYFRRNIVITDMLHISLGLGIGLILSSNEFLLWGIVALTIGALGHVYAFIKGDRFSSSSS
jgi:hypothetical protein